MAQPNDAGLGGGKLSAAQRAELAQLRKALEAKIAPAKPKTDVPTSGYNYTESSTASGQPAAVRQREVDQATMSGQAAGERRRAAQPPPAPPKPTISTVQARPMQSQLAMATDDFAANQLAARNAAPPRPQPKPETPANPWGTGWGDVAQGVRKAFSLPTEPEPQERPKGVAGAAADLAWSAFLTANPSLRTAFERMPQDWNQLTQAIDNVPDEIKRGVQDAATGAGSWLAQSAMQSGVQPFAGIQALSDINEGMRRVWPATGVQAGEQPAPFPQERDAYLPGGAQWGAAGAAQTAPAAPQPPAPVPPAPTMPQGAFTAADAHLLANAERWRQQQEQLNQLAATPPPETTSAFGRWMDDQPWAWYAEDTARGAQEFAQGMGIAEPLAALWGGAWSAFVTSVKAVENASIADLLATYPASGPYGQAIRSAMIQQAQDSGMTVGQAGGAVLPSLYAATAAEFGIEPDARYPVNVPPNANPLQVSAAAWSQVPAWVNTDRAYMFAFNENWQNTTPEQVAMTLASSGPSAMEKTQRDVAYSTEGYKDDLAKAAALYDEAEQLADMVRDPTVPYMEREAAKQRAGELALEAVTLFNTATEASKKSLGDIYNENADIRSELLFGYFADPVNLFDVPMDAAFAAATALRMARRASNVGRAPGLIDDAMKAGAKLAELTRTGVMPTQAQAQAMGVPLAGLSGRGWFQQLLGRTGDNEAHRNASAAMQFAAQVFAGVDNPHDARLLLETMLTDPRQFLTGVQGLTGEYYRHIGAPRFGANLVGSEEAQQVYILAQTVADELRTMRSLDADIFDINEFLSEVDTIFYRAGRQVRGLTAIDELPYGAVDMKVVDVTQGAAQSAARAATPAAASDNPDARFVVSFVDRDGQEIATSLPMTQDAAQQYTVAVRDAMQAGKSDPLNELVRRTAGVQRAFLSDMWLNLRPGHWIRNASAAMAATMSDGIMTFDNMADILTDAGKKFAGGAGNERIFNAATGRGRGLAGDVSDQEHWARQLTHGHGVWDKANLYAAANEFGQRMWTGMTHVLGTSIPFGEQAYYTRAWYSSFRRAFTAAWDDAVMYQFGSRLRELQVPKPLAESILNRLRSAGITGSKADVAKAAREAVMGATVAFDLRSLGIPDELISIDGWKEIDRVLQDYARGARLDTGLQGDQRAIADIKRIFDAERTKWQRIMAEAPPQQGVYDWTATEIQVNAAEQIDTLTTMARNAGIPEDQARARAQALAERVATGELAAWQKFIQELASRTEGTDGAMNVAFDLMAELHDLRRLARAEVDKFSRAAADATPATRKSAWNIKWAATEEIYEQLAQDTQAAFDKALTRLRQLAAGEPVEKQYDWWNAINRYTAFDEEQLAEARALALGSTKETEKQVWEKVIDANRKYVDSSYLLLFEAFRRFPDLDALDIIRATERQIDITGNKAAAFLRPIREALWQKTEAGTVREGEWDAYFALRNRTWNEAFDNQVLANRGAVQAIVANGLAKEVPSGLRWTEDFPGHAVNGVWQPDEYMVIGLQPDGLWRVRETRTGEIIQMAGAGDPTLPRLRALLLEWMTPKRDAKGRLQVPPLDQGVGVEVSKLLDAQAAGQALPAELPPAVADAYRELITRARAEQAWTVPANVIDDYYRATQQYNRQLAQVMDDIKAAAPQAAPEQPARDLLARAGVDESDPRVQAAAAPLREAEAKRAYIEEAQRMAEEPVQAAPHPFDENPPAAPADAASDDLSDGEFDRLHRVANAETANAPAPEMPKRPMWNNGYVPPEPKRAIWRYGTKHEQEVTVIRAKIGEQFGGQPLLKTTEGLDLPLDAVRNPDGTPFVYYFTPYEIEYQRQMVADANDQLQDLTETYAEIVASGDSDEIARYAEFLSEAQRLADEQAQTLARMSASLAPDAPPAGYRNAFTDEEWETRVTPQGVVSVERMTPEQARRAGAEAYAQMTPEQRDIELPGMLLGRGNGLNEADRAYAQGWLDARNGIASEPSPAPPRAATPAAGAVTPEPAAAPASAPPASPAAAFVEAPSATTFGPMMQRAFRLTDDQAAAVDLLARARANVWARQTGRSADEWYGAHFAGIVQGGVVDDDALLQALDYNTPEFRAWFGDSKVVDGAGQPLRVYHATTADFEAFDRAFAGKNTGHATTAFGFFFSESPKIAEGFASSAGFDQSGRVGRQPWIGAADIPAHLTIKNPYTMTPDEFLASARAAVLGEADEKARAFRERLIAEGYDGIRIEPAKSDRLGYWEFEAPTWIAFEPNQIKTTWNTRPTSDPRLLRQQRNAMARGAAEFLDDGRAILRGLEAPDVSTAVHEMAHVFRRDLATVARRDDQAAADLLTVRKWAGLKAGQDWTREAEEMFARGFEAYLRTGTAPAPELASIFEKFKAWLTEIYRALRGEALPKLKPEVRGVFDRLLADKPAPEPATFAPRPQRQRPLDLFAWKPGSDAEQALRAAEDARASLAEQWHIDVQGHWADIPDLDNLVMRFSRAGTVNMRDAASARMLERLFSDVYGTNLGGFGRIESLADVERVVQNYVDAAANIREARNAVREAERFVSQDAAAIVESVRDELAGYGFSAGEIDIFAQQDKQVILDTLAALREYDTAAPDLPELDEVFPDLQEPAAWDTTPLTAEEPAAPVVTEPAEVVDWGARRGELSAQLQAVQAEETAARDQLWEFLQTDPSEWPALDVNELTPPEVIDAEPVPGMAGLTAQELRQQTITPLAYGRSQQNLQVGDRVTYTGNKQTGQITAIDPATNRMTVTYPDGKVRSYDAKRLVRAEALPTADPALMPSPAADVDFAAQPDPRQPYALTMDEVEPMAGGTPDAPEAPAPAPQPPAWAQPQTTPVNITLTVPGEANTVAQVYQMPAGPQQGKWAVNIRDVDADETIGTTFYPTQEQANAAAQEYGRRSIGTPEPTAAPPRGETVGAGATTPETPETGAAPAPQPVVSRANELSEGLGNLNVREIDDFQIRLHLQQIDERKRDLRNVVFTVSGQEDRDVGAAIEKLKVQQERLQRELQRRIDTEDVSAVTTESIPVNMTHATNEGIAKWRADLAEKIKQQRALESHALDMMINDGGESMKALRGRIYQLRLQDRQAELEQLRRAGEAPAAAPSTSAAPVASQAQPADMKPLIQSLEADRAAGAVDDAQYAQEQQAIGEQIVARREAEADALDEAGVKLAQGEDVGETDFVNITPEPAAPALAYNVAEWSTSWLANRQKRITLDLIGYNQAIETARDIAPMDGGKALRETREKIQNLYAEDKAITEELARRRAASAPQTEGIQTADNGAIMGAGGANATTDRTATNGNDNRPLAGALPADVRGAGGEQATAPERPQRGAMDAGRGQQANPRGDVGAGSLGNDAPRVLPDSGGGRTGDGVRGGGAGTGDGGVRLDSPGPEPAVTSSSGPRYDHVITDVSALEVTGGPVARYDRNMASIRVLKTLEAEKRMATPGEQKILALYAGWGDTQFKETLFGTRTYGIEAAWLRRRQELLDTLTQAEYEAARRSSLNAHYTTPQIVTWMYDVLDRMGINSLNRLRVLDPSTGAGVFFGMMPPHLAARAERIGVDLDSLSARITQQLYQNAQIINNGYERASLPANYFDLAITNVPFADNYMAVDPSIAKKYDFVKRSLHNYYFAKAEQQVRPGGVVAFITSRYTMDSPSAQRVRQYLDQRYDFLGATRLPETAFKGNANTEVVTDVIFLRKRTPGQPKANVAPWVETGKQEIRVNTWTTTTHDVNQYFLQHPEMVLGRPQATGTMYERNAYTVVANPDEPLETALARALEAMPANVIEPRDAAETVGNFTPVANAGRPGYRMHGGRLKLVRNNSLTDVAGPSDRIDRLTALVQLRDTGDELLQGELHNMPEADLDRLRKTLNQQYDAYTRKHGALNSPENRALLEDDPATAYFVQAMEIAEGTGKKQTWKKTEIFNKRVVRGYTRPEKIAGATDALALSLHERGRVDIDHIASSLGRSTDDAIAELGELVYKDPYGDWETKERYLSGNVRQKLAQARVAAADNPDYARNVAALEAVQPQDLLPSQITVRLGSPWVPPEEIAAWMADLLGTPRQGYQLRFLEHNGAWSIERVGDGARLSAQNTTVYGFRATDDFPGMTAIEIIDDLLNSKTPKVYAPIKDANGYYVMDADGKPKIGLHADATAMARDKAQAIRDHFSRWIWQDPDRAERLVRVYNDKYNVWAPWRPDGSHIKFIGMTPEITMRPTQANAVWRMLQGNTLLAHEVGAGKTFTMMAGAMEARRLGIARKPVMAVLKSTYESMVRDARLLYPGIKLLAPTPEDFSAANRMRTLNRIATGDWDLVIITHDWLTSLPVRPETFNDFISEQIAQIDDVLKEVTGGLKANDLPDSQRATARNLERQRRTLEAKFRKVVEEGKRDTTIYFEDLGIDMLMIDEAHYFKNLFYATQRDRIPGLSTASADRSVDMFLKVRTINRLTGGRGVTFATGTPMLNTMSELYTMQKYLQYDTMENMGLLHFDNWANNYAMDETVWEMSMTGASMRPVTKFTRFTNVPELYMMASDVVDWLTMEDVIREAERVGIEIGMPKVKRIPVLSPKDDFWIDFINNQERRLENLPSPSEYKPGTGMDHYFKVHNDSRFAAVDLRLVMPQAPDHPQTKVNQLARNVKDVYDRTMKERGAQVIFSDIGVPSKLTKEREAQGRFADLYKEIVDKLVKAGIPRNEIAVVHDAKNAKAMADILGKVKNGEIRVVIGSTKRLGVGTNFQTRLKAIHQLDVLGRPGDIDQRMGRIVRQGNIFKEIEDYRYLQEPLDSYNLSRVSDKARAFEQFKKGDSTLREIEDVDEHILTMQEYKALASGNPAVMQLIKAEDELNNLARLRRGWMDQIYATNRQIARLEQQRKEAVERIPRLKRILSQLTDNRLQIGDQSFDSWSEMADFMEKTVEPLNKKNPGPLALGKYRGFDMTVAYEPTTGPRGGKYDAVMYTLTDNTGEIVAKAEHGKTTFDSISVKLSDYDRSLASYEIAIRDADKEIPQLRSLNMGEWQHQAKFDQLTAEVQRLRTELGADRIDEAATRAGGNVAVGGDADFADDASDGGNDLVTMHGGLGMVDPSTLLPLGRRARAWAGDLLRGWRKGKDPEVGEVALHQIKTLDDAEARVLQALPGLRQPTPNNLTTLQRNQIIDLIDRQLLPAFDDAAWQSARVGEEMANGAMLNYRDRRGFDQMLSLIFPYHYFWSRGGLSWARRMARKPSLLNTFYELQRAIDRENERGELPSRLKGTIFAYRDANGQYRLQNPLAFVLPFHQYFPNRWESPEDADSAAEQWYLRLKQYTPGFLPAIELGAAALLDQIDPVTDGPSRVGELARMRRFVPLAGIAADARQAMTGETTSPYWGGDNFDQYRIRRDLSVLVQNGGLGADRERAAVAAQNAQQIALNLERGADRYANIAPDDRKEAERAYQMAARMSGKIRMGSSLGGWATGVAGYYLPQGEQDIAAQSQTYGSLGYQSPDQPYGSAALRRDFLDQNPALPVSWSRNTAPGETEPATSARKAEYYSARDAIYAARQEAVDAALTANPNLTSKQMNAIVDPFYDQLEQLEIAAAVKAYSVANPNATQAELDARAASLQERIDKGDDITGDLNFGPPSGKPPSGANMQEQAIWTLEQQLSVEGKPVWPGDNATKAEVNAYYDALDAWKLERDKVIAQRLDVLRQQLGEDAPPELLELFRLIDGMTPAEIVLEFQTLKYASEIEKDWQRAKFARDSQPYRRYGRSSYYRRSSSYRRSYGRRSYGGYSRSYGGGGGWGGGGWNDEEKAPWIDDVDPRWFDRSLWNTESALRRWEPPRPTDSGIERWRPARYGYGGN